MAMSAGESVYLLAPQDEAPRTLHSVYGHPVTCLDASGSQAALGVKSCGWAMNDAGNKVGSSKFRKKKKPVYLSQLQTYNDMLVDSL